MYRLQSAAVTASVCSVLSTGVSLLNTCRLVVCVPHSFPQCHCPRHRQPVCVHKTINTSVIVRCNNTGHDLVCFCFTPFHLPLSVKHPHPRAPVSLRLSLSLGLSFCFLPLYPLHPFIISVWLLCSCQLVELLLIQTEREVEGNRGKQGWEIWGKKTSTTYRSLN